MANSLIKNTAIESTGLYKTVSNAFSGFMLTVFISLLSACGVVGKKSAPVDQGPDITVPPVLIDETRVQRTESNPDEIVSYDDWQKDRQEAAKKEAETQAKELEAIDDEQGSE